MWDFKYIKVVGDIFVITSMTDSGSGFEGIFYGIKGRVLSMALVKIILAA